MRTDLHMHCYYSADSDAHPNNMIKSAISKGLKYICFTDHQDWDFPYDDIKFEFDTEQYFEELNSYKELYSGRITILIGVELGLQPHLSEKYNLYLQKYPFDFCIGSSHVVNGMDPYYPEFFEGREEKDGYLEYYQSILDNLNSNTLIDVYGHIDYILRYGPSKNSKYGYCEFSDIIDEILKKIIESGKGIEINTAGFRYKLGHPNPEEAIIKRYKELGGEIVTVGSDAHKPLDIAFSYDKVPDILKNCGFDYYTVFSKRKPQFIKL